MLVIIELSYSSSILPLNIRSLNFDIIDDDSNYDNAIDEWLGRRFVILFWNDD